MSFLDKNGVTSPEDDRHAMHLRLVTPVAQDEVDPDQNESETELTQLRSSNHRLRAENLTLRTRIERLKSNRSLERSLIIGGMVLLWFFFVLSVITKLAAVSN